MFQRALFVVDLGCAVVSMAVAFGYYEIFPSLFEVRVVDLLQFDLILVENVLGF